MRVNCNSLNNYDNNALGCELISFYISINVGPNYSWLSIWKMHVWIKHHLAITFDMPTCNPTVLIISASSLKSGQFEIMLVIEILLNILLKDGGFFPQKRTSLQANQNTKIKSISLPPCSIPSKLRFMGLKIHLGDRRSVLYSVSINNELETTQFRVNNTTI